MAYKLYDLAGAEDDRRFSPYCGRVKMALRHKALGAEEIAWRFTEKDAIAFSGQKSVPVLIDGGATVTDSWEIARYLERRYPDRPRLFADYIVFGAFQFVCVMSPIKLLESADPVSAWRERLLDAFSGYARQAIGHDV